MKHLSISPVAVFLMVVLFCCVKVQGQSTQSKYQDQIYQSFITGDVELWQATIEQMESAYVSRPGPAVLYDLLLARYGYIAMQMEDHASEARKHLQKAEEELDVLFRYTAYQSRAYALQGAFLGFRISLRPLSAIRLGPRSYRAINQALEADPDNPTAWMEKGNSRFYTPSTFGGSKQQAQEGYQKAIELFERDLQPNQRWLYLNSLVGLAKSYTYLDKHSLAIATYEKALRFEPDFKWVRDELLPELLKSRQ